MPRYRGPRPNPNFRDDLSHGLKRCYVVAPSHQSGRGKKKQEEFRHELARAKGDEQQRILFSGPPSPNRWQSLLPIRAILKAEKDDTEAGIIGGFPRVRNYYFSSPKRICGFVQLHTEHDVLPLLYPTYKMSFRSTFDLAAFLKENQSSNRARANASPVLEDIS